MEKLGWRIGVISQLSSENNVALLFVQIYHMYGVHWLEIRRMRMRFWSQIAESHPWCINLLYAKTTDSYTCLTLLNKTIPGDKMSLVTARKRSLGQGNIFTPVCHSVHRGECLARYTPLGTRYTPQDRYTPGTRYTPWDQVHPPGPGTPPGPGPPWDQVHPSGTRYTPQELCMLGDTGNKQAVRILLECILVLSWNVKKCKKKIKITILQVY